MRAAYSSTKEHSYAMCTPVAYGNHPQLAHMLACLLLHVTWACRAA